MIKHDYRLDGYVRGILKLLFFLGALAIGWIILALFMDSMYNPVKSFLGDSMFWEPVQFIFTVVEEFPKIAVILGVIVFLIGATVYTSSSRGV